MVAHFCIDKILLSPSKVDKLLLGRQVEIQESFDKFGTL